MQMKGMNLMSKNMKRRKILNSALVILVVLIAISIVMKLIQLF
ncbi:hypothetical protein D932_03219 [Enterococcus casseliflavus 14-MB-W-14]|nr:hypothetical protein D932_03219 [Enterococcus casseliflavus 14-MB-W-14]